MKKSKQQEELEEGLDNPEDIEEDEEDEEVIEDDGEEKPQVPVQKGLVYQSAPEQHTLVDGQTGETIIYANDLISFDRSIAVRTLEFAREAAINSEKE